MIGERLLPPLLLGCALQQRVLQPAPSRQLRRENANSVLRNRLRRRVVAPHLLRDQGRPGTAAEAAVNVSIGRESQTSLIAEQVLELEIALKSSEFSASWSCVDRMLPLEGSWVRLREMLLLLPRWWFVSSDVVDS